MTETSLQLIEEELHLRSLDQTALFVRRVRPRGEVRARLAWVHGFAEHGGRYMPTLRWLAERGFDCWILDLRGHGRSAGRRTFVNRFDDYLGDMQAYFQHVDRETQSSETPLFALGHSMGGLVLTRTLQDRQDRLPKLKGAVIFSPFMGVKVELPVWKTAAARILSRVCPRFALPSDLDHSRLSKDPAVWDAYDSDPLVTKSATARWYTETLANQSPAIFEASRLILPVLVMHGEDDGLADPAATRDFFSRIAAKDKELKMWAGLRHELLNEVEKGEVREHLLGWLEARLA